MMHVVLLLGSSTAGKSSLCKELATEHKWHSNSVDEVGERLMQGIPAKLNPLMLAELKKQGSISKLQSFMTEEEVLKLAATGLVSISIGDKKFNHQFQNPKLQDLEQELKKAGFNDSEIAVLAEDLRLVTKIGDDIYTANRINPMESLYDETFIAANSGKSIVLDVVPSSNDPAQECFDQFEKCAQQFREKNPDIPLKTSVIFAYCPPQKLSERIQERNRKAEINNPMDKRVGLFPFYQLAALVTADKKFDDSSENIFTRTERFHLLDKHASTDKHGDSLFLENPVDPDALQPTREEKVPLKTTKDGVVSLSLDDRDLQSSMSYDKPRVGSAITIEEYGKLAARFGFFEDKEKFSLNIPSGISFDAVINTSKNNPATLANEFLEKLEKSKTASHRVSRL